jgi:hypothetical protein
MQEHKRRQLGGHQRSLARVRRGRDGVCVPGGSVLAARLAASSANWPRAAHTATGALGRRAAYPALSQPRLRWARMAEMVAAVASALPPPKGAILAKPWVSASNCR